MENYMECHTMDSVLQIQLKPSCFPSTFECHPDRRKPQLCRACLTSKETFLYCLFKNVPAEIFTFCTSIQVNEMDEIPKTICDDCYGLISKYAKFKQTCIQSQNILLSTSFIKIEEMVSETNLKITDIHRLGEEKTCDQSPVKEENYSNHFNEEDYSDPAVNLDKRKVKEKTHKSKKRHIIEKNHSSDMKTEKSKKPFDYPCQIEMCNKKFKSLERYQAHQLKHEGKSVSLVCTPCNKTFKTWNGLERHREKHATVPLTTVSCGVCGRVCASRHTLRVHQRMHCARATHVCHICGKSVSNSNILRTHLETHKADRERCHTCEHCGNKFFTNTMLLSHISRQHTDRRYICDYCQYPFTDKYNLSRHILIHYGKKPYTCDICHKAFSTNGSLVEHKRIHSGERPYSCNYCFKSFLSRRRLTDHHRIHTGEKPHGCNVCKQRFSQRGSLRRHMKIHERVTIVGL